MYTVITYAGGNLRSQDLQDGASREAVIDGRGSIVVSYDGCPNRTTGVYRFHGDTLFEVKRVEERTLFIAEDECPG